MQLYSTLKKPKTKTLFNDLLLSAVERFTSDSSYILGKGRLSGVEHALPESGHSYTSGG